MAGGASSGDVEAATMAIVMAIEDCCEAEITYFDMAAMNIGDGLTNLGMNLEACCTAWSGAGAGSYTAPEVTADVPDGMGGTTTITVAPEKTVSYSNWGGVLASQSAHQCQAQMHASTLYNQQYNAWLEAYQEWQENQVLPQLLAFGLQVASLIAMYDQWTKYLEKTNTIMCGLADEVFPCVKNEYLAIKDEYKNCIADYEAGLSDDPNADLQEKVAWHCILSEELLDCWQNDGTGQVGYKILEAQHTQNMAQSANNVVTDGQWAVQDAKQSIIDLKALVDNTFSQWGVEQFPAIVGQIEQLYSKAGDICDYLNTCGQAMADNYGEKSADIQMMLMPQVTDAVGCLNEIQDAIADADTCMQQQKDHYDTYHEPLNTYFAAEVLNEANSMLLQGNLMDECRTMAGECANGFKDKYQINWAVNEEALANKILEMACATAMDLQDEHEWQEDLSRLCLAHWEDNYMNCDAQLGAGIMEEAKLLYNTRKDTFDEFVINHDKLWDFWCDHYQPLEQDYSQEIISKATQHVCDWLDAINKVCDEACDFLDWYRCYQDAEKETGVKIINAGIEACEQQAETYNKLDQMLDDLCKKWFDEVCGCELTDIQELCKIHDKAEVACEVNDNSQCVQDIADALKECYLNIGLTCEKAYLQELCNMEKYQPDFCDLEDRAIIHIRRQFSKLKENLRRNQDRHCVGDFEEQMCKIEAEQVRQEAMALESANRFERWWEVQECDRRHGYKMQMIEVYQGFAAMAIQGFDNSTEQYDKYLTQIHNRLSRAYNMLSQANQAGSTTANSAAAGVSQALQSIQNGQFYADLFLRMKSEHNQASNNLMLRGQEQTRIGQQYTNYALDALQRAENTANSTVQQGLQSMQHGKSYKDSAINASQLATQTARQIQDLGLQWVDRGHFWVQESRGWKGLEWQVVCDGIQKGQTQAGIAQRTLDQAFMFEQHRDQLIQMCRDNGMQAAGHQLEIFNSGIGKVERAMASAENAIEAAMRTVDWGQQQRHQYINGLTGLGQLVAPNLNAYNGIVRNGHSMLAIAAQQNQIGMDAQRQSLLQLCEMLRERERAMCQKLLGFNAIGQGTSALANQFGQGLTQSAQGVIGSIQAFTGQSPSILGGPIPGGNSGGGQVAPGTSNSAWWGSGGFSEIF